MYRTVTAALVAGGLVLALAAPALADPVYTPHPAGNPPTETRRQLGGPPVDTSGPVDPLPVDPKHRPPTWRHNPAPPALPNHLADPPVCVQPSDTGCQNEVTGRWVPAHRVHHQARTVQATRRAGHSAARRLHRRSTPTRSTVHLRAGRHRRPSVHRHPSIHHPKGYRRPVVFSRLRGHCWPVVHHRRHRHARLRVLWVANRHAYAWLHAYKHGGWIALGFKTIGARTRLAVLHR